MTFHPTDDQRKQVEAMAGYGVPQPDIALVIGVSEMTLRKYFALELTVGVAKANARVGQSLFNQAINGNTTAMIFWLKSRAGWREVPKEDVNADANTITVKGGLPE